MKPIDDVEICKDFLYFKKLLNEARKLDDNLNHKLNNMKNPQKECPQLKDEMSMIFHNRRNNINFCIENFKTKQRTSGQPFMHKKELALLKSELVVEDILQDRAWEVLYNKCRNFISLPDENKD
jgi:hypothetical protein